MNNKQKLLGLHKTIAENGYNTVEHALNKLQGNLTKFCMKYIVIIGLVIILISSILAAMKIITF